MHLLKIESHLRSFFMGNYPWKSLKVFIFC